MRRAFAVGLLAVAACKGRRHDAPPPPPPPIGAVHLLAAHAGATELWHDGDLWVSVTRDWNRASPIRISHGDGAVEFTATGAVIGVHDGAAVLAVPGGADTPAGTVQLERWRPGAPIEPIALPPLDPAAAWQAVLTGTGTIVVAGTTGDRAAGDGHTALWFLDGAQQRELEQPGFVGAMVAARDGRVAFWRSAGRAARDHLVVVDPVTGAEAWSKEVGVDYWPSEGRLAFTDDGSLWVMRRDHVDVYDRQGAVHEVVLPAGTQLDPRNLVVAGDGATFAFARQIGCTDMALACTCPAYFVRVADGAGLAQPVERPGGQCYFGRGMAIVDGALWLAPLTR